MCRIGRAEWMAGPVRNGTVADDHMQDRRPGMGAHDSDNVHPVLRAISVPPRTCFGPGFCTTLAAHGHLCLNLI